MAKLRNVSADTLSVPLLGRSVEPDEVVEVEDRLLKDYDWPETLWSEVAAPKKTTTTNKDEE